MGQHKIGVPVAAQNPDLEMLRDMAHSEIRDFSEQVRETLTGGASPSEIAAWPNKAERARRFLAGSATEADTLALSLEAQSRGLDETPQALAELQLGREAQYAQAVAFIDGLASRGHRLIASAKAADIPVILDGLQSDASQAMQQLGIAN